MFRQDIWGSKENKEKSTGATATFFLSAIFFCKLQGVFPALPLIFAVLQSYNMLEIIYKKNIIRF
jgi:hypothetical protein